MGKMIGLKIFGTLMGIIGAIFIASNTSITGFGFIIFLLSSCSWFKVAIEMKEFNLAMLQFTFILINIFGIARWFF